METFSRLVWAIGPYLSQNEDGFLTEEIRASFIAGTDPTSKHYFGALANYDQKFVEMAALATCLLLNKETIWQEFSLQEKENSSKSMNAKSPKITGVFSVSWSMSP